MNLALRVGSRRPDGFHPLTTLFFALSIFDRVSVENADEFSVTSNHAGVPVDESNLVVRAAQALNKIAGTHNKASIHIDKQIPIAGGMAGGSADGAAALVALNELWGLGLGYDDLHTLAADLGSDVPFALHGGLALGTSRGEELTPVECGADLTWVLVRDRRGLSTPAVFRQYDQMFPDPHEPASVDVLLSALKTGDPHEIGPLLANDLAPAAFELRPDIADKYEALKDRGVATILSGSGPTLAILAESTRAGHDLAGALWTEGHHVICASGPVPGAVVEK